MGLVMLQSGRPIFYGHTRWGQDGATFKCWKFRTMSVDADARLDALLQSDPKALAEWNATAKLKDDPRVTAIGRILRRTSLDELPQLFCVLFGTMSLVGPRPLPERYVARYSPRQASRLFVRPGLTGWAQTHGRNAVDWDKRLSLDADYVAMLGRPFGLLLDLRILAATAGQVLLQALTGRGVSAPGHATMQEFRGEEPRQPQPAMPGVTTSSPSA